MLWCEATHRNGIVTPSLSRGEKRPRMQQASATEWPQDANSLTPRPGLQSQAEGFHVRSEAESSPCIAVLWENHGNSNPKSRNSEALAFPFGMR